MLPASPLKPGLDINKSKQSPSSLVSFSKVSCAMMLSRNSLRQRHAELHSYSQISSKCWYRSLSEPGWSATNAHQSSVLVQTSIPNDHSPCTVLFIYRTCAIPIYNSTGRQRAREHFTDAPVLENRFHPGTLAQILNELW